MDDQVTPFNQLTELPYGLAGRVFRSPMPFQDDDPTGEIFRQYQEQQVQMVVVLAGDEECETYSDRNLRDFYRASGLKVISMPIEDYGVPAGSPDETGFTLAVEQALAAAAAGSNLAIHCYAGRGRTGLFAACLAKRIFHFSGDEAIQWVRRFIPGAVETPEQTRWVNDF